MVSATNRQMPSAPANQRDHRYIPRWTAATPHCATDSGGRSGQSCVALEDAVVGSCPWRGITGFRSSSNVWKTLVWLGSSSHIVSGRESNFAFVTESGGGALELRNNFAL